MRVVARAVMMLVMVMMGSISPCTTSKSGAPGLRTSSRARNWALVLTSARSVLLISRPVGDGSLLHRFLVLVDVDASAQLRARLEVLNPGAPLYEVVQGEIDLIITITSIMTAHATTRISAPSA